MYWTAVWVKQLTAEYIAMGCGGGNYYPNDSVIWAEVAVILVKKRLII